MPSKGEGRKKSIRKKLGELFILIVVVPLLFFAFVELIMRVSGVDTEVVKSKKFKIATPVWTANDFNFFAAEGLYRDIVHNNLPAAAADWMQYFEEARYVRYKMKPDISVRAVNTVNRIELEKGIKVQLTSNGNGFRSRELPVKKGENVYRIAVLGDSTAFGWGVNQEERFSDVLEEKLNAAGGNYRYEVLNFGIPGYTTFHGRAVFDRYVLKYSPDMVILSFGANDGKKISATAKRIMQSKGVLEDLKYFLWNFKTYKLLRKLILSRSNPFDRISAGEKQPEQKVPYATLQEFRGNLEYIIDRSQERGIQPVLLGLCCPIDYLARMSALAGAKNVVMLDGMQVLLRSIPLIQAGTLYPSLARYYRNLYGEEVLAKRRLLYVTNDTCHPNALGHHLLADTLYHTLFQPNSSQ